MTPSLTFNSEYIDPILKGEKRITWRVNYFDDLRPGDQITLETESGAKFALAEIEWFKRTIIDNMTKDDVEYHQGGDTRSDVVEQLRDVYSDDSICIDTQVAVIRFKVIESEV